MYVCNFARGLLVHTMLDDLDLVCKSFLSKLYVCNFVWGLPVHTMFDDLDLVCKSFLSQLCMFVILLGVYQFIPCLMTLTLFASHSGPKH